MSPRHVAIEPPGARAELGTFIEVAVLLLADGSGEESRQIDM
jgi:hypothetical protein